MQHLKEYLLVFVVLVFLGSCQKNIDDFIPDTPPGPDTTWQAVITPDMQVQALRSILLKPFQLDSFTVNSTTGIILNTSIGLRLNILPFTFITPNGISASGRVHLRTALLRKKGEMISNGFPTISQGNLMISGAELFISARNDTTELLIAPGKHLNIKIDDINPYTGLKIFNGINILQTPFNWVANPDTLNNKALTVPAGYEVITNRLGWMNAGKIPDTTGVAQLRVAAGLPAHYTNANSMVFVSFNNQKTVLQMEANVAGRYFRSLPLPVGAEITVMVISKQENDYYLGHRVVTVTQSSGNTGQQIIQLNPVRTSLENIKQFLAGL